MDSRRFHQARMKKCQAGNEEIHAVWCRMQCRRNSDFRYGIAKILQGLRKFRNGSENVAVLAKFSLCHIFAMIAKVTVHNENSNFRYACNFRYDSEIHYA